MSFTKRNSLSHGRLSIVHDGQKKKKTADVQRVMLKK